METEVVVRQGGLLMPPQGFGLYSAGDGEPQKNFKHVSDKIEAGLKIIKIKMHWNQERQKIIGRLN